MLSGNRNAYAELVRRYEGRVRGYCRLMLSEDSLAEDAAQEVFIKAYQALETFRGNSKFSTWIYRISANHCTDIIRKIARRRTISWEALLEQEGEKIENLFCVQPQTDLPGDAAELVSKLLAHLPEKSREMLILREVQGLSYEELAKTLDCSLDAVKSRLRRARQELGSRLRHFLKAGAV